MTLPNSIQRPYVVGLAMAKRLKKEGFTLPTEYYYQDKDLCFSSKGLKRTKNSVKMNHNKYDKFVYSAPPTEQALSWLIGKYTKSQSSVSFKFSKSEGAQNV